MSKKIKVKKLQNSPYVIAPQQLIGKGSFSAIVRAYNLQNPKQELVSKIISVKDAQTNITIKAELQILKKLPHHPNLVNCMKSQIFSENNFYLIMEYCNEGNLDKYLVRKKFNIPQEKIWFFLKQFCEGYKVLYNNGIVHRDIKPENILIHNGDFKIADFGLSKKVQDMQVIANMSTKGTPLYMAPEIHVQKEGSSKVDVFSLGVVLYKMAFNGQYPFFDQNRRYRSVNEYFKQLLVRNLAIPTQHRRSQKLINLIQKMLVKDKQKRISWKEIFEMGEIKSAIRFERKKELAPLDELQRSLMIVNKSQTQVHIVQSPPNPSQSHQNDQISSIVLQQTFNKKNKSNFQKILFKNKLLYTLIEYTNKKIETFNKKTAERLGDYNGINGGKLPQQKKENNLVEKYEKLYKHISKKLQKIIQEGILYSLYIISKLQLISGDWSKLNEGEIMNFQDIFQNDKGIFIQQYKELKSTKQQGNKNLGKNEKISQNSESQTKQKQNEIQNAHNIRHSYQDILYNILNEYFEYPQKVRAELTPIFALLVNVYDLAVKSETEMEPELDQSKNLVEKAQDQTTIQFYQYLIDIQTLNETSLKLQMQKKGLIFL